MESHFRSIAKAVTWRTGGTLVTFTVAWVLTGEPTVSVGIGIFDAAVKIFAFYAHERLWNRLNIGKRPPPEYEI
jgi:uncharacterized membrane protein